MRKLTLALLCSLGLSFVSLPVFAENVSEKSQGSNMQLAAWWGDNDKTWCERHPRRCAHKHHRMQVKYERHERWCDNHPKRCAREQRERMERHHRYCERHPNRCK